MCQNTETECYPFRNPQPVKLAEKRSDALRTPDGEYKSSSGVENGGLSNCNCRTSLQTFSAV